MQFLEELLGEVFVFVQEFEVTADDKQQSLALESLLKTVHVPFIQITHLIDNKDHLIRLWILL